MPSFQENLTEQSPTAPASATRAFAAPAKSASTGAHVAAAASNIFGAGVKLLGDMKAQEKIDISNEITVAVANQQTAFEQKNSNGMQMKIERRQLEKDFREKHPKHAALVEGIFGEIRTGKGSLGQQAQVNTARIELADKALSLGQQALPSATQEEQLQYGKRQQALDTKEAALERNLSIATSQQKLNDMQAGQFQREHGDILVGRLAGIATSAIHQARVATASGNVTGTIDLAQLGGQINGLLAQTRLAFISSDAYRSMSTEARDKHLASFDASLKNVQNIFAKDGSDVLGLKQRADAVNYLTDVQGLESSSAMRALSGMIEILGPDVAAGLMNQETLGELFRSDGDFGKVFNEALQHSIADPDERAAKALRLDTMMQIWKNPALMKTIPKSPQEVQTVLKSSHAAVKRVETEALNGKEITSHTARKWADQKAIMAYGANNHGNDLKTLKAVANTFKGEGTAKMVARLEDDHPIVANALGDQIGIMQYKLAWETGKQLETAEDGRVKGVQYDPAIGKFVFIEPVARDTTSLSARSQAARTEEALSAERVRRNEIANSLNDAMETAMQYRRFDPALKGLNEAQYRDSFAATIELRTRKAIIKAGAQLSISDSEKSAINGNQLANEAERKMFSLNEEFQRGMFQSGMNALRRNIRSASDEATEFTLRNSPDRAPVAAAPLAFSDAIEGGIDLSDPRIGQSAIENTDASSPGAVDDEEPLAMEDADEATDSGTHFDPNDPTGSANNVRKRADTPKTRLPKDGGKRRVRRRFTTSKVKQTQSVGKQ